MAIFIAALGSTDLRGQQLPLYTQYIQNGFMINPAMAGHDGFTSFNTTARQQWLEIPQERVEWRVGNVLEQPATGIDLIYLYRPVRPEGRGIGFYQRFAADVERHTGEVVIMSVTDCLRPFLSDRPGTSARRSLRRTSCSRSTAATTSGGSTGTCSPITRETVRSRARRRSS